MKHYPLVVAVVVSLVGVQLLAAPSTDHQAAAVLADSGPDHHVLLRSDAVAWQDGPKSLPSGAQFAVLEGDPAQPGVFTMRLKLPDEYAIPPHWHPNVERVTVISGSFLLGSGESFHRTTAERLEAGSYTSMPPGMRHYAYVEGETTVQLTSVGPWEIHYVNAEDDPRLEN